MLTKILSFKNLILLFILAFLFFTIDVLNTDSHITRVNTISIDGPIKLNTANYIERIILEIEKMIEEMGFNKLNAKKERIIAELHEKKGNWKNALEHYYISIDEPPG